MESNDGDLKVMSNNNIRDAWVDPYQKYWDREMVNKTIICTAHPTGRPGAAPVGFVVGRVVDVVDGNYEVCFEHDEGRRYLMVAPAFVHSIVRDDEPIPDKLGTLTRLN